MGPSVSVLNKGGVGSSKWYGEARRGKWQRGFMVLKIHKSCWDKVYMIGNSFLGYSAKLHLKSFVTEFIHKVLS